VLCPSLQFLDHYLSAAAGPHKWPKLVDFLQATYARITADLAQRQQNQVCVRMGLGQSLHGCCRRAC